MEDVCAVYNHVNRNWQYRYDKNAEFFFGLHRLSTADI
jgi:hypothetical protein